ncbi:MAG: class I SAM-dependent methyltransferase [Kiritimatiellae bacterium]|nr:class I SAM-dependent methyltransferase [Kiritimatiellia bacterium]
MTMTPTESWLEIVRRQELEHVLPHIPAQAKILELGAGAGFQAKVFAELGFEITALDVPQNRYHSSRVWDVMEYDGHHIPFEDNTFDVVFTSNVLEHVHDLHTFLAETRRVLRETGLAIHVVPSATWRVWTNVAHYVLGFRALTSFFLSLCRKEKKDSDKTLERVLTAAQQASWFTKLIRTFLPPPHGVVGTSFAEILMFTRLCWRVRLEQSGWKVGNRFGSQVFYTGHELLTTRLPLRVRRALSRIIGSSSHIFLLRKIEQPFTNRNAT